MACLRDWVHSGGTAPAPLDGEGSLARGPCPREQSGDGNLLGVFEAFSVSLGVKAALILGPDFRSSVTGMEFSCCVLPCCPNPIFSPG